MAKVVDEPASRALTVLTAGNASGMTDELRIAWTRFLMAMNLRSPHLLADATTLARDIVRTHLGSNPGEEFLSVEQSDNPPSVYSRLESDAPHFIGNLGKLFLPGLIDNEEIAYYLINMHWVVLGLPHSEYTLLVGDGPFIRTHGLKDRECLVAVPIGPKLLFVASNSKDRQAGLRRFTDTKIAGAVNMQTVGIAVQHVFGRDRSHLQFVENRLRHRADLS